MELDRSVSWFQNRSVELQPISKCKIYIYIRKSIWKGAPHTGHTTQNGLQNLKCINFIEWTGPTERTEAERGFYLLLENASKTQSKLSNNNNNNKQIEQMGKK